MKKAPIILAVLIFIAANTFAQNQHESCASKLKNLSVNQIKQLEELEKDHQKIMADFRTERRSTSNLVKKEEVRTEMLNQKEKHHSKVKKILSKEQWKEFLAFHEEGNENRKFATGNRNGHYGFGHGKGCSEEKQKTNRDRGSAKEIDCKDTHCKNRSTCPSKHSTIDTSKYHSDNFKIEEF